MNARRLIVGITGASAPIYGIRLLETLRAVPDLETHLVLTRAAETTLRVEMPEWTPERVRALAHASHEPDNLAAPIASGSFRAIGMAVVPCSMKTLGGIASGAGGDLLSRAADVTLKERRRLVLVPRETPFHLGHLRNMTAITEAGGIILPPIPAFYHRPKNVDDLIHHTIGKLLDLFGIEHALFARWGE